MLISRYPNNIILVGGLDSLSCVVRWELSCRPNKGALIRPQPDLLPDVVGRTRECRWKDWAVHVPNCKSFLVTEAERKHVRRSARFQQHGDASSHQEFFFLQGKARKEIHALLTETLREYALSCATVKTGWPSSNTVIFPPVMDLVLEDSKQ